jgi:hypothetical protein
MKPMNKKVVGALIGAASLLTMSPSASAASWYYCDSAKAYYPYVSTCPEAWRPVDAQSEKSAAQQAPTTAPVVASDPLEAGNIKEMEQWEERARAALVANIESGLADRDDHAGLVECFAERKSATECMNESANHLRAALSDWPIFARSKSDTVPTMETPVSQAADLYQRRVAECAYLYLVQTGQIILPSGNPIPHSAFVNSVKDMLELLQGKDLQEDCIRVAENVLGTSKAIDSVGR